MRIYERGERGERGEKEGERLEETKPYISTGVYLFFLFVTKKF